MTDHSADFTPEQLHGVLLHLKYLDLVRRIARGSAHSYNNIFTGLTGLTAARQQDRAILTDQAVRKDTLVKDLLQRGIAQTSLLSEIARPADKDMRLHSHQLVANKVLELLRCISRLHRFTLDGVRELIKIRGNFRDMVLALCYLGERCIDSRAEGGEIMLTIASPPELPGYMRFGFKYTAPVSNEQRHILYSSSSEMLNLRVAGVPLGLYAAKFLVERFGGQMDSQAFADGATEFSAAFPVVTDEISREGAENTAADSTEEKFPKQCFLVVDDDGTMRKLLLDRLQRRGHMVFCVESCREAIMEYSQLSDIITVVLLDIGLRDGTGYECRTRMLAINPDVKVIFMSGLYEDEDEAQGGNTQFLQKPFTMAQLEQAVKNVQV